MSAARVSVGTCVCVSVGGADKVGPCQCRHVCVSVSVTQRKSAARASVGTCVCVCVSVSATQTKSVAGDADVADTATQAKKTEPQHHGTPPRAVVGVGSRYGMEPAIPAPAIPIMIAGGGNRRTIGRYGMEPRRGTPAPAIPKAFYITLTPVSPAGHVILPPPVT